MKVHKIRGIDKSVCCKEQMIAYNMASACDIRKKQYRALPTGVDKAEMIVQLRDYYMNHFGRTYTWKGLNPDAVFVALNQGLETYMNDPVFVNYTSYKAVGKAFPIPYDIE